MKWVPKALGAEPKKLAMLGGLVVVLVVVYWINRPSSAPVASVAPVRTAAPASPVGPRTVPNQPMPAQRSAGSGSNAQLIEDFRPSLKRKEGVDVSRIDPTLKLDLLAKLQEKDVSGGSRNVFEFSQPPAPPPPKVKPIVPQVKPVDLATAPPPPPPAGDVKPPKAPPTTIPLKFYGYAGTTRSGKRSAFFLDGEDIFVASETEVIRNRYKVVRIGVNSAVVEDTSNQNQQTLTLMEEQGN